MMTITELRSRRISAEIPAILLAANAKVNRCRLSALERGHVCASEDELRRLATSLAKLISAKEAIQRTATDVGWPARGVL
jgi:hypothetical protein